MTTAEMAPQPKLMINVPQSGILSKPSTAASNHHDSLTALLQLVASTNICSSYPQQLLPLALMAKPGLTPERLVKKEVVAVAVITRMTANVQRDGRPAEYRWRPLFKDAKFG